MGLCDTFSITCSYSICSLAWVSPFLFLSPFISFVLWINMEFNVSLKFWLIRKQFCIEIKLMKNSYKCSTPENEIGHLENCFECSNNNRIKFLDLTVFEHGSFINLKSLCVYFDVACIKYTLNFIAQQKIILSFWVCMDLCISEGDERKTKRIPLPIKTV